MNHPQAELIGYTLYSPVLVGGIPWYTYPSEKKKTHSKVSWGYIPKIWKIEHIATTNQINYKYYQNIIWNVKPKGKHPALEIYTIMHPKRYD